LPTINPILGFIFLKGEKVIQRQYILIINGEDNIKEMMKWQENQIN